MAQGELRSTTDGASRGKPRNLRLTTPTNAPMLDRRLEDWITLNLDPETERPTTNLWTQIIHNLPLAKKSAAASDKDRGFKSRGEWDRFHVVYRRGVTIVRLTDRSLVQRADINELAEDVRDLIDAGNHRLILNFSKVERLGSWIVAAAVDAHRRCESQPGGRLKVCGLETQLAEIFHLIGLGKRIVVCEDEQQAVDGDWPGACPRTLPLDLLEALVDAAALPPLRGGAPAETTDAQPLKRSTEPPRASKAHPDDDLRGQVWLRVECGGREGRMLAITKRKFSIGRDHGSHLRLGAASVSKRHATIELRDGRAYLVDHGSTNGTQVNGETVQNAEVELNTLDRIVIGPAHCQIWVGVTRDEMEQIGAIEPSWTSPGNERGVAPPLFDDHAEAEVSAYDRDDDDPAARIKHEVFQDVLVVTPVLTDLDDERANESLRLRLAELAELNLPRRVVLNVEFVGRLSRRTIGVILAHHLRLDRAGGGLRICNVHPRVMALLDQVRLPLMVDCHPTLDEAVLTSWEVPARASS